MCEGVDISTVYPDNHLYIISPSLGQLSSGDWSMGIWRPHILAS